MPDKPLFTDVLQVAVVVKDLDASMKRYWDGYGIGPWTVYTFDNTTVKDMILDDKKVDYAMRLALTDVGKVQWELIQPLDDKSLYAQFLKEHGEGLHHIALGTQGYEKAMIDFRGMGLKICQGGTWHGFTYTYLNTEKDLGLITEIYGVPPDFQWPKPEATYP